MRDGKNLNALKWIDGYSYEGVYMQADGSLYIKLRHVSGVCLNIKQIWLNEYIQVGE
jgi:hypothetical protein